MPNYTPPVADSPTAQPAFRTLPRSRPAVAPDPITLIRKLSIQAALLPSPMEDDAVRHNEAVRLLTHRWTQLAALPAVDELQVDLDDLHAERRTRTTAEITALRDACCLVDIGADLLQDGIAAFTADLAAATAKVDAARDTARQGLSMLGCNEQTGLPGIVGDAKPGTPAAARQFQHAVEYCLIVREAKKTAADIQARIDRLQEAAAQITRTGGELRRELSLRVDAERV